MVAQFNFERILDEQRSSIKTAFHWLLLEYGKHEDNGDYTLDITKLGFPILWIPCQRIIRSGCEIFIESYDDAKDKAVKPICCYDIEQLARFYDALAKVMNKELTEQK